MVEVINRETVYFRSLCVVVYNVHKSVVSSVYRDVFAMQKQEERMILHTFLVFLLFYVNQILVKDINSNICSND